MAFFDFLRTNKTKRKNDLQFLANLFYIAISDGEVSEKEQEKINEIRISLGISQNDYDELIKDILNGKYSKEEFHSPISDDEAWNQLIELTSLASIDGEVDDNEIKALKLISKYLGYDEDNNAVIALEALQKSITDSKKINQNLDLENHISIDWNKTEDIGIVTHLNDEPFTGIAFSKFDNGNFSEKVELVNGLKHGTGKFYNEDGSLDYTCYYKDDLILDYDELGWRKNMYMYFDSIQKAYDPDLNDQTINKLINTSINLLKKIEIYHDNFYDNFKNKILDEIQKIDDKFGSNWTKDEIIASLSFLKVFAFKYYDPKLDNHNDLRLSSIVNFTQLCFKSSFNVKSIEGNAEWNSIIAKFNNYEISEKTISVIMSLGLSKKYEFLFMIKALKNAIHSLLESSDLNQNKITNINTNVDEFYVFIESILNIKLSQKKYNFLYESFCLAEDSHSF